MKRFACRAAIPRTRRVLALALAILCLQLIPVSSHAQERLESPLPWFAAGHAGYPRTAQTITFQGGTQMLSCGSICSVRGQGVTFGSWEIWLPDEAVAVFRDNAQGHFGVAVSGLECRNAAVGELPCYIQMWATTAAMQRSDGSFGSGWAIACSLVVGKRPEDAKMEPVTEFDILCPRALD